MALLGGEANFVGIDIGSSGIRLVQLKHGGSNPLLVTYGEVAVPLGLTQSDSSLDREKVAETVAGLLKETNVSSRQAVLGIPSTKVYASVATVPVMTKAELEKGVRYEAEQHISVPLEQLKLDWLILEGKTTNPNEMDVLIVGTPNQTAQKYHELCVHAGLELVGLEPNALAMSRALVPPSANAVVVIDMGGLITDFTIVQNGTARLIRSISIGGLALTKAVAQHLSVSEDQTMQFISKFGLTGDKLEGQVYEGLKPVLDNFVAEVQRSIDQFKEHHQGATVERIVLTGSASAIPELPPYLATAFNLPVEIGDPWRNISYPATLQDKLLGDAPRYAVAAGLAQMEVN